MKKNLQKGFSLIELLVVIAIIGVLASVVLSSLATARLKAGDAAIKANLSGARSQAALFLDNNGHYGDVTPDGCSVDASGVLTVTTGTLFADPQVKNQLDGLVKVSAVGSDPVCLSYADTGSATSWAISSPLKTDPAINWCTDSGGESKQGTASVVNNVAICS